MKGLEVVSILARLNLPAAHQLSGFVGEVEAIVTVLISNNFNQTVFFHSKQASVPMDVWFVLRA